MQHWQTVLFVHHQVMVLFGMKRVLGQMDDHSGQINWKPNQDLNDEDQWMHSECVCVCCSKNKEHWLLTQSIFHKETSTFHVQRECPLTTMLENGFWTKNGVVEKLIWAMTRTMNKCRNACLWLLCPIVPIFGAVGAMSILRMIWHLFLKDSGEELSQEEQLCVVNLNTIAALQTSHNCFHEVVQQMMPGEIIQGINRSVPLGPQWGISLEPSWLYLC